MVTLALMVAPSLASARFLTLRNAPGLLTSASFTAIASVAQYLALEAVLKAGVGWPGLSSPASWSASC